MMEQCLKRILFEDVQDCDAIIELAPTLEVLRQICRAHLLMVRTRYTEFPSNTK
jgi:hypothetical protein